MDICVPACNLATSQVQRFLRCLSNCVGLNLVTIGGIVVKRIMIIGGHGAGKTTLALKLGEITGLPVVHIDRFYHLPRWKKRPQKTAIAEIESHANTERWIMDGDDFRSFAPRLKRTDMIIYLHVSTLRRVARVFKRAIKSFDKPRVDLPDGCRGKFSLNSLKWAAFGYPMKMRPAMHKAMAEVAGEIPIVHLRSESDVLELELRLKTGQPHLDG